MPFQTTELTTTQYDDLHSNHRSDWFVIANPNTLIFQAQVAQPAFDTSFGEFLYDNITVGAYTDVLPGFTVFISHTDEIREAFFVGRVRKAPTSNTFYINETSLSVQNDDRVFVIKDICLREKHPHEIGGVIRFDWDFVFRKLLPIIRGVQTVYYKRLSGGVADFPFTPTALASESGAAISSWANSLDGGSYQAGNSTSQNFTARYTAAGVYYPRIEVTDSGGRTNWFSPMVIVNDDDNSIVTKDAEVNGISRKSSNATLTVKSGTDLQDMLDNTQVVVVSEQRFGTGETDPILTNIIYIGRIRDEDSQLSVNFRSGLSSSVSFKLEGLAAQMGRLILASIAMQRVASSTAFGHVTALTLWRAIVLIATELSTLSNFTELTFDSENTDYGVPLLGADSRGLGDSVTDMSFAINAFMKFAPSGEMKVSRHIAYLSSTNKALLPIVANFDMVDWNENLRIHREHVLTVGRVMGFGGSYNTSSGKVTALRAIAPSRIFSSGAGRNTLNSQVLKVNLTLVAMKDEIALRTGAEYALRNEQTILDGELPSNYEYLYAAHDERYTWTIPANRTKTGRGYDTADFWYLDDVTLNHDYEKHRTDVGVRFILDTVNVAARVIAEIAPQEVPWTAPALNLLPSSPFPMLDSLMYPGGSEPSAFDVQPFTPYEIQMAATPGGRSTAPTIPDMTNDPNVKKGNVVAIWNGDKLWVTGNFTRTRAPTWMLVTPGEDLDIHHFLWQRPGAGGWCLSEDGADSTVWRSDLLLAGNRSWESEVLASSLFKLMAAPAMTGIVYAYAPSDVAGTPFLDDYDFTVDEQGWASGIRNPYFTAAYIAATGWRHIASDTNLNIDISFEIWHAMNAGDVITDIEIDYTLTAVGNVLNFVRISDADEGAAYTADIVNDPSGSQVSVGSHTYVASGLSYTIVSTGIIVAFLIYDVPSATDNIIVTGIRINGTRGGSGGDAVTRYSDDGGETFDSEVVVGTSPGDEGGFTARRSEDTVFAAQDGKTRTASAGGAYSDATGGGTTGTYPLCLWAYGTAGSFIKATPVSVSGESLWKVVGGTATAITPNDGSNDGLAISPNCVCTAPDNDSHIFALLDFGGTIKLAHSTNGGASWSFTTTNITSNSVYIRAKNTRQVYIANGNNILYSENGGATFVTRTAPATGIVGIEVR